MCGITMDNVEGAAAVLLRPSHVADALGSHSDRQPLGIPLQPSVEARSSQ